MISGALPCLRVSAFPCLPCNHIVEYGTRTKLFARLDFTYPSSYLYAMSTITAIREMREDPDQEIFGCRY